MPPPPPGMVNFAGIALRTRHVPIQDSSHGGALSIRVNHSNVAFSSWSMLYQHTRHRNSNKFKTLCQKLASVFGLPVAQTRNCRRNYQIFSSSRKTLKMTFFHRYVLPFKIYLFLMKIYCTMSYKNLRFWHLIT